MVEEQRHSRLPGRNQTTMAPHRYAGPSTQVLGSICPTMMSITRVLTFWLLRPHPISNPSLAPVIVIVATLYTGRRRSKDACSQSPAHIPLVGVSVCVCGVVGLCVPMAPIYFATPPPPNCTPPSASPTHWPRRSSDIDQHPHKQQQHTLSHHHIHPSHTSSSR